MEKETIEETADKYVAKNKMYFDTPYEKAHSRVAFIGGAKWQAERMYSEEEVLDILYKHTEDMFKGTRLTLTEWFEQFKKN
jgi:hypothetical protein